MNMNETLVQKLRSPTNRHGQVWALCEQAADEIERLERIITKLEESK
jgi:hypothetical protein